MRGDIEYLDKRTAWKIGYALSNFAMFGLPGGYSQPDPVEEPEIKTSPNRREGFVYLLHCNGAYKIGHAKVVDKRVSQIEPVMPYPVEVVFSIPTSDRFLMEAELHAHFRDRRLRGEWFALDEEDVLAVKEWVK